MLPILFLALAPARADVLDLDRIPDTMRHVLEFGHGLYFEQIPWGSHHHGIGDLDGDGDQDLAILLARGFMAYAQEADELRILWQENLPEEHLRLGADLRLTICRDLNGDGRDEVVYTHRLNDRGDSGLCIIDHYGDERFREFALPTGEDINEDGRWDAWYQVVGTVPDALPDGRAGLLLGCVVRYDRYGRGLRLIDPEDGSEAWRFETGPNPTMGRCLIRDLDGDGSVEIVFVGNSPNNMGGEAVNGSSDDRAWIFVLNAKGERIWDRPHGIHFFTLDLALGDLTGDGRPELVTSTGHHSAGASGDTLTVFDSLTGEILAQTAATVGFNGLAIAENRIRRTSTILCTDTTGEYTAYELRRGRLERRLLARSAGPLLLLEHGDVFPDVPGFETLLVTAEKRLILLDALNRPLGNCESPYWASTGLLEHNLWRASPDRSFLVGSSHQGRFGFLATSRPRPLPAILPLGLFTALVLAFSVLIGLSFRHRAGSQSRESAHREQLLQIIDRLLDASHGRFPATDGLMGLLEILRLAQEGESPRARSLPRLRLALTEFKEANLGELLGVLEQAERCGLRVERARETRETLLDAVDAMDHLAAQNLEADILEVELEPLDQSFTRVKQDLLSIRNAARRQFKADPHAMLGRLLAMHSEEFDNRGIALDMKADEGPNKCHIDPCDLHYILDNLIENALRAMSGNSGGRLKVALSGVASNLRIDITDTGDGVPMKQQKAIFEAGYTTRDEGEGGGFGLSRSREQLYRWGGKLELLRSEEGKGCCFRLTLPLVERPAVKSPHMRARARGAGSS